MIICIDLLGIPIEDKRNPFNLIRDDFNVEILSHESIPIGDVIIMKLDKRISNLPSYITDVTNKYKDRLL